MDDIAREHARRMYEAIADLIRHGKLDVSRVDTVHVSRERLIKAEDAAKAWRGYDRRQTPGKGVAMSWSASVAAGNMYMAVPSNEPGLSSDELKELFRFHLQAAYDAGAAEERAAGMAELKHSFGI